MFVFIQMCGKSYRVPIYSQHICSPSLEYTNSLIYLFLFILNENGFERQVFYLNRFRLDLRKELEI